MRTHFLAASLTLVVCLLSASRDVSATSCHPREYQDHLRHSEWVFVGTVSEASIDTANQYSINISLTDIDALRGDPPETIELRAGLGAYDPKITIGEKYIVYANSGDPVVGFCKGFAIFGAKEMFTSVLFRRAGTCGPREIRYGGLHYLREEFLGQRESPDIGQIRQVLLLYEDAYPSVTVHEGPKSISIKGFDFLFSGDRLESIELGYCDA